MLKVLIVDDEEDIREGLKNIVDWEKQGFIVSGLAGNGIEAMKLYYKEKPHLIITDIKMPGMDGLEFVKQLRLSKSDVAVLIISGYNDFSYAREAIKYGVGNYLLKPVDVIELCKELDSIREEIYEGIFLEMNDVMKLQQLKNYFITRLIRGELSEKNIEKGASQYNINIYGTNYCVLIIELGDYKNDEPDPFGNDIELKILSIGNIMNQIAEGIFNGIIFEISESKLGFLIVGNIESLEIGSIKKFANKLLDYLQKYSKQNVWIGVGEIVPIIRLVQKSYLKAEEALEMRFYNNCKRLSFYDEISSDERVWNIGWSNSDLMEGIRNCDKKRISSQVEQLFANFDKTHISVKSIHHIIISVIIELAKTTLDNGGNWETAYRNVYKDIDFMLKYESIESVRQYIVSLCFAACDAINKANIKERNIDEIIKYINQFYNSDLNLRKLSDIFYINSSYLGKLIKRNKGKSFNDYLNELRITNSINLLKDSPLSIKEISEKVGYNYIDHFYRNFKSFTGKNPGEYRNNSLKDY